ncbi:hypothetical protein D917_01155 [Trichinella nativa]|uniref:Uncharacterized protein n=1 Tax=Trichinella nativa TaxID=6335 RepID=A0A1Y3EUI1_9BILA|nr:hypothetical protein D917_01155 [Trichinella nativa]
MVKLHNGKCFDVAKSCQGCAYAPSGVLQKQTGKLKSWSMPSGKIEYWPSYMSTVVMNPRLAGLLALLSLQLEICTAASLQF